MEWLPIKEWMLQNGAGTLAEYYAENLRSNLFGGFLTLCAFLFSVKAFLLVTLQKDVYGTVEYGKRIEKLRQANPKLGRYSQLRRLNRTIFWAVVLTFVAAVLQLTVGLVDANWAAAVCIAMAVVGGLDVAYNLCIQRIVVSDWLGYLEGLPDPNQPAPANGHSEAA